MKVSFIDMEPQGIQTLEEVRAMVISLLFRILGLW